MRDESDVIAFTLALKFAFIVANSWSSAAISLYDVTSSEIYCSCPHGLLPENVPRSDALYELHHINPL
jgi:hypothetical protein